jgi:hypothetical protein
MPKYKIVIQKITEEGEVIVESDSHREAEDALLQQLAEEKFKTGKCKPYYRLRTALTVGE